VLRYTLEYSPRAQCECFLDQDKRSRDCSIAEQMLSIERCLMRVSCILDSPMNFRSPRPSSLRRRSPNSRQCQRNSINIVPSSNTKRRACEMEEPFANQPREGVGLGQGSHTMTSYACVLIFTSMRLEVLDSLKQAIATSTLCPNIVSLLLFI